MSEQMKNRILASLRAAIVEIEADRLSGIEFYCRRIEHEVVFHDAAEEAEKSAILRALKESRLEHEKSRKRLALQNLIAFIVIVAGIVLRTVLFGGH